MADEVVVVVVGPYVVEIEAAVKEEFVVVRFKVEGSVGSFRAKNKHKKNYKKRKIFSICFYKHYLWLKD